MDKQCKAKAHELLVLHEITSEAVGKVRWAADPSGLVAGKLSATELGKLKLEKAKEAELHMAFVSMAATAVKTRFKTSFTEQADKKAGELFEEGEAGHWDKVHTELVKLNNEVEDELYSIILDCGCEPK